MDKRGYFLFIPLAIIILALMAVRPYIDWLWFDNLGLGVVFWTVIGSRWALRLGAWLFFFLFLSGNLYYFRRSLPNPGNVVFSHQLGKGINPGLAHGPRATLVGLVGSGVLSFFLTGYTADHWLTVQQFLKGVPFDMADPLFNHDLGEYVFRLPFYLFVNNYLQLVLVVTIITTLALYFLVRSQKFDLRGLLETFQGTKHVLVLVALFFLLKAWDYSLKMLQLLYSTRGVAFGASFADVNAHLPGLRIMAILSVLVAAALIINLFLERRGLFLGGIGALALSSILLGTVYPAIFQQLRVAPNEAALERPYIEHNINFTRKGYSLDRLERKEYPGDVELTAADIDQNPGTIENIRLWDYRPLQQSYQQLQAMRLYYRFNDIDTDRYTIDGDYRQVMLAARELDQAHLDEQAQTWVNQRLKFTHGYGLVMSPVNEFSPEGLPRFIIGDIPPRTETDLEITRPEIYYGELTNPYVIVNTREEEFDYPLGDTNAYTTYEGTGGVPVGSPVRKAALALRLGDYRMLLSNDITPESRVLLFRNISQRVRKAMPLLDYDPDPYLVLSEGRLFWIQDAYTRTDMFPYSQPLDGRYNYVRNSVKVVIDSYNGDLRFFISDSQDPIIHTYAQIFPGVFEPLEEMPAGLRDHIRYPEYFFSLQAQALTTYHMQDPMVFYNREDQWQIPTERYFGASQAMEPYYTIIQLPGQDQEEFVLMLPFTPRERNNMVAWLAGRNDGDHYAKLLLYAFPKDRLIMGPSQIENRIDQSPEISQLLSLWDQRGSRVIRGNLLVLPINGGILYVEPVFLEAENAGLPELTRVILAYQDRLVMEPSLEDALAVLFEFEEPTVPPTRPPGVDVTLEELAREANQLFQEAQQRSQAGDWAGYGRALSELEEVLQELAELGSEPLAAEGGVSQ